MSPVSVCVWTVVGLLATTSTSPVRGPHGELGRRSVDVDVAGVGLQAQGAADADGVHVAGARAQVGAAVEVLGVQVAGAGGDAHMVVARHLEHVADATWRVDHRHLVQ